MEVTRPTHGSCRSDTMSHVNSPMNNMLVAVRLRPITDKEIRNGHRVCCKVVGDQAVVMERFGNPGGHLKSQQSSRKEYAFDIAFPPEASQDEVYTRTVKDLMPTIVDGYNATIFAYGATGAGKTHTMMGSEREGLSVSHNHYQECEARQVDGIIPHALTDIFRLIDKRKKEETIRSLVDGSMYDWKVFISYLEVYNEQIRDLLQPSDRPLSLREDQARNIVHVAGLHQEIAHNVDEVLDLLRRGNRFRKTEPTAANQVSSRSHAVIQVIVRHTTNQVLSSHEPQTIQVEGKLSLIDLAGSERASATQNRGLRLTEGANINKSLLALANCINALSTQTRQLNTSNGSISTDTSTTSTSSTSKTTTTTSTKVQYRDSKLTHLLKNSLEGECRLVMIANVNPSHTCFEESHNTLKYANRAKKIRICPKKHLKTVEMTYQDRIMTLEKENIELRNTLAQVKKKNDFFFFKKRKENMISMESSCCSSICSSSTVLNHNHLSHSHRSPSKRIKTEEKEDDFFILLSVRQQMEEETKKMKKEIERLELENKRYRDFCTCQLKTSNPKTNEENVSVLPLSGPFQFKSGIPKLLATNTSTISPLPVFHHKMIKYNTTSNTSMIPRPKVHTRRLALNDRFPFSASSSLDRVDHHHLNNLRHNKENFCHTTEACTTGTSTFHVDTSSSSTTTTTTTTASTAAAAVTVSVNKVPIQMKSGLKKPTVKFERRRTKLGEITNQLN